MKRGEEAGEREKGPDKKGREWGVEKGYGVYNSRHRKGRRGNTRKRTSDISFGSRFFHLPSSSRVVLGPSQDSVSTSNYLNEECRRDTLVLLIWRVKSLPLWFRVSLSLSKDLSGDIGNPDSVSPSSQVQSKPVFSITKTSVSCSHT